MVGESSMTQTAKAATIDPKRVEIDWNEPPLARWLGEISRESTKDTYKFGWKAFSAYTGLSATQLLDEAVEDMKRDPRERKGVILHRLLGYYNWLTTEYPVYNRGKGKHTVVRKGLRPKTANGWVQAVRSFYGTFDINVKMKGKSRLPKPRVYNKRMELGVLEVRALVQQARNPRDRAILLTLFQGGMDVSTLISIRYEDVREGLQKDEYPLRLSLFREKTGIEYYTFLGRDAISAIKSYLNELKSKDIFLQSGQPLFVKLDSAGKVEQMETQLVQKLVREAALRSGLVDESKLNGKDMSPCNPHALREAFGSIMINKGVPDTIVDFWLGHAIGEMAQAYKSVKSEELKKLYLEREAFISITAPESEITEKYTKQVGELQGYVNSLLAENMKLKEEMSRMKGDVNAMKELIPSIKEVVNWHKEIKAEEQLEKESKRFHPYPPHGWKEQRKREILEGE
jgi:site-specific recombinase XerD